MSQNRKLAKLFKEGGTIDRFTAYEKFKVQNLTARIAELRADGMVIDNIRMEGSDLGYWKLRQPKFNVGDRVVFVGPTLLGDHDLRTYKVKVGTTVLIERVEVETGCCRVDFGDGLGTLWVDGSELAPLAVLPTGTPVKLPEEHVWVEAYDAATDTYYLKSATYTAKAPRTAVRQDG